MTIERLKELEAKATIGPWRNDFNGDIWHGGKPRDWVGRCSDANAALIASARNALPALIAVAEAAKAASLLWNSGTATDDEMCAAMRTLASALAALEEA